MCGCTRARWNGRWPGPPSPKADPIDERRGQARDERGAGDVERYEQLRRRTLAGDPAGWRLGLAELERRGVAGYLAVDPDNRLVADTLEADWNDALRALRTAQHDYQNASAAAVATLTEAHKARIRALAADFPTLWSDPATPPRERKRMTRLLIDDVTLVKTDQIHLHVRFRGGQTTSLAVPIPPTAWQARQTHPDTLAALDRLLTPTPTPRSPTPSTPPVAPPARASRSPPASCCTYAAHTGCPATPSGYAPPACSPSARSPPGSP